MKKIEEELLKIADFPGVSEKGYQRIMEYIISNQLPYENAIDCHIENSEEELFNWINEGLSPIKIKKAPMPSEMTNVVEADGKWVFWYS